MLTIDGSSISNPASAQRNALLADYLRRKPLCAATPHHCESNGHNSHAPRILLGGVPLQRLHNDGQRVVLHSLVIRRQGPGLRSSSYYSMAPLRGPVWLSDERIASHVAEGLHYRHGKVYQLDVFTIMANHVHMPVDIRNDSSSDRLSESAHQSKLLEIFNVSAN